MTAQDVQAICSSAVQAAKAWLVACSQAAGLRSSAAAEESASPQMRHYPTAAYPQSAGCIFVCPAHRHRPGIFATVLQACGNCMGLQPTPRQCSHWADRMCGMRPYTACHMHAIRHAMLLQACAGWVQVRVCANEWQPLL